MEEITVWTWTKQDYLTLKEDCIVVYWLNKERVIPISQIISFEVKDPKSKLRPGMIKIQLGGAPDTFLQLNSFLTLGNNGNVEFPHAYAYLEDAHRIKEYVANYAKRSAAPPPVSVADEIKKYKDLLDCGAITEDEYAKAKNKLLR